MSLEIGAVGLGILRHRGPDLRRVAGLGNKDGSYYVVDRNDGELVWSAEAQRQTGTGKQR